MAAWTRRVKFTEDWPKPWASFKTLMGLRSPWLAPVQACPSSSCAPRGGATPMQPQNGRYGTLIKVSPNSQSSPVSGCSRQILSLVAVNIHPGAPCTISIENP